MPLVIHRFGTSRFLQAQFGRFVSQAPGKSEHIERSAVFQTTFGVECGRPLVVFAPRDAYADVILTTVSKHVERLKLFSVKLGHSFNSEGWAKRHGDESTTVRGAMSDETVSNDLDTHYDKGLLPVFAGLRVGERARTHYCAVVGRFCDDFFDHPLADIFIEHTDKRQRRVGLLIELAGVSALCISEPRLKATIAQK